MAIGLEGHTVSLTKNGYLKLIKLIIKYPSKEILKHLDEISLNHAQARKMLAGDKNDILPIAWDSVKAYDPSAQYALLLVSIIFSHKTLIELFKNSTNSEMQGVVYRKDTDEKTYTNLAYALNEAGVALDFTGGADKTTYDLSPIFSKNEIGPLAKEILKGHLENMGWKEPTTLEPFQRTFYEQIESYEFNKVLGLSFGQLKDWLEGIDIIRTTVQSSIIEPNILLQEFISCIKTTGLQFTDQTLYRFISSLATKPFVLLSGLSGSGKTKLAQAFAQWICQDDTQYCIVPVGADWTNREPILGYPNALKADEYIKPDNKALDVIIEANKHPELPYFLILDEMNLSHVERYFADFLSVMESKDEISLFAEGSVDNGVPSKLSLPENLFIIGTVNIDETTYMFSPKVLDRANTIEFRVTKDEINSFFINHKEVDMDKLKTKGASMSQTFLEMAKNKTFPKSDENIDSKLTQAEETLVLFFEQLKKTGAEFGYRTANEIIRLINQLTVIDADLKADKKLDIAIMQKLLPKLHGSRRKLCPVLITLGGFCVEKSKIENIEKDIFSKEDFNFESENVKYPLSLEKIYRMYRGAIDNGFASYAEA